MMYSKTLLHVLNRREFKASRCKLICLMFLVLAVSLANAMCLKVFAADQSQGILSAVSPIRQQMKLSNPSAVVPGGRGYMPPQMVVVKNPAGNPLAGIPVKFEVITGININAVMRGYNSKTITVVTDENGYASAANTYAAYLGEGYQVYSQYSGVVQTLQVTASVPGWNTVTFEVEVGTVGANITDNTPPSISASARDSSGASYVAGKWTNLSVTVHYEAKDTLSAIKSCTQDQVFENEGANQSAVGTATDAAIPPNSASITYGPINIDKSAPVTTVSMAEPLYDPWNNENVIINLESTDIISGVDCIYYRIGSSAPVKINGNTAVVEVSTEGTTDVSYLAVDKAGNTEIARIITVKLDKTGPTVSWLQSPDKNGKGWNSSDTAVTLKAADTNSGVKEIHYKIGAAGTEQVKEADTCSFTVSTEGITPVTYWAVDNAGYASTYETVNIKVDKTVPLIEAPKDITVEATAVLTPVSIGFASVTDVSEYTLKNDDPKSFPIGTNKVTWTATDSVGNVSSAVQTVIVKDTTNPVLTVPGNVVAEAAGIGTPIALGLPEAKDIFNVTITSDAPAYFPLGLTVVTWTARDANGNTVKAKQNVTVIDSIKPELTVPPNIIKEATARSTPVDLGEASAKDIFEVTITNNAPESYPVGTTIVEWKAEDANGNVTLKEQVIVITDTTKPVLTVSEDITVEASARRMKIDIGKASAYDIFNVLITNDAPYDYPVGTTKVTWTAKDENNNITAKVQNITVKDTTKPVLILPEDKTVEATGVTTAVYLGTPDVYDIFDVAVVNNAPETFGIGQTVITWTAADENGNFSTGNQSITVIDTTKPLLTVPVDKKVEAAGRRTTVNIGEAAAKDIFSVKISNDAPADYPIGTTTVNWKAEDANGNISTAVQKITVEDTILPELKAPADINKEATGILTGVDIGQPTVYDIFEVTYKNNAPAEFPLGTTIVTWTAKDENGNISTASQKITVVDTTPPDLKAPADVTREATNIRTPVDIGKATASDYFGATIENDAPADFVLGTTIVKWTAKDANGNTSTAQQKVIVTDKTPPSIKAPEDIVVEAKDIRTQVDTGKPTYGDIFAVTISNNAPIDFPIGKTVITWTAKDANGNISTAVQNITVQDTTVPKINVTDTVYKEATGITTPVDIGVPVIIEIFEYEITNNAPAGYPLGETLVTWMAKDVNGNVGTKVQKIIITDKTAPELTVPEDKTVEATAVRTPVDIGQASAKDIFAYEITNNAPVDYPLGETLVTWTAKDVNGNVSTKVQKVTITDKTAPELTVPEDVIVEATALRTPVDIGLASAKDIFTYEITNNALADYPLGETLVTWTAKDVNGNVSTKVQKVTITDKTAPELTIPEDVTVEATAIRTPVDIGLASAKDIFAYEITNNALADYPLGETLVIWTAKDVNGNVSTKVQKITITDKTAPELTIPEDKTAEATAIRTPVDIGLASAKDIFTYEITNNALEDYPLGENFVTWTAKDVNGNVSTKVQKITITDKTAPELTVPEDVTVEATAIRTPVDIGLASAKDIFAYEITNNAPADYPLGETLVTWTAKDVNGNVSTKVQKVTITDKTPPELTVPEDKTVEATALRTPVDIGLASAKDIFAYEITNNAPADYPLGETLVTWTAKDVNGNVSTKVQKVTITDKTPPELTIPEDKTVEATALRTPVDIGLASAKDIFAYEIMNNALADYPLGDTFVTWTAKDVNGNVSTKVQKITITDKTPPELTIPEDKTVEATAIRTPVDIGLASAKDIFAYEIMNNALADYPLGETLVRWTAKDVNGNVRTKVQKITITDKTPPELTIPEDKTVEATALRTPVDIGLASAKDIFEYEIMNNALADYPLGDTFVTWTAKDVNGNVRTKVQKITITDKTPPELTIPEDKTVEATALRTPVDIGLASAKDIFAYEIMNNALADYPLGDTFVTWTAKDVNGNVSTKVQKVTITDKTPPELTVPEDKTVEATALRTPVDIGLASAKDIFEYEIMNNALEDYPLGETLVTWTAKDVNGNVSTKVQKVTITDKTAPVLVIPADITVMAVGTYTPVVIGTATATDIFEITITNDAPATGFPIGKTAITWRAVDSSGNITAAVQYVTVIQGVRLKAYNNTREDNCNSINPYITIENTGSSTINLADLKIRYYYTIDGEKFQNYWCDYAEMRNPGTYNNITSSVKGYFQKTTAKAGSDYYLEISFNGNAGSLKPGGKIMIQSRFAKIDWSMYRQSDDYSYNSQAKDYTDSNKITVYYAGVRISGIEP